MRTIRRASAARSAVLGVVAMSAVIVSGWTGVDAQSAPKPPQVKSPRLYVFDCGVLVRGEPTGYNLTTAQVGGNTNFSDACFLVVHPRGTLLWDVGIIPDAQITPGGIEIPLGRGSTANKASTTLKSQISAIGYQPKDITYIAVSHGHADHVANANDYSASTWLVQRAERDSMFSDQARTQSAFANYSGLEHNKTVLLDGDHDVFGDGTVMLISTPGHTPGHQSLDKMTPVQKKAAAEYKALRGSDPAGPPWAVLLRVPDLLVPALQIRLHYVNNSVVDQRLTEFAIFIAARQWTNNFEFGAHYAAGVKAGLKPEIIAAVAEGRRPDGMADDEAIVYDVCTELQHNQSISDPTYARALAKFGEAGVVELAGIQGYYTFLAAIMNAARVTLPANGNPMLERFPRLGQGLAAAGK